MSRNPADTAATIRLTMVARCADIAFALVRETEGVQSATVSTSDGLPVASTLPGKEDADKMAALSGSIAALASALTREAGHGEPDRVILESMEGQIVSMRVVAEDRELVLTVVAKKGALLGKVLWSCRAAADQLAAYSSSPRVMARSGA